MHFYIRSANYYIATWLCERSIYGRRLTFQWCERPAEAKKFHVSELGLVLRQIASETPYRVFIEECPQ